MWSGRTKTFPSRPVYLFLTPTSYQHYNQTGSIYLILTGLGVGNRAPSLPVRRIPDDVSLNEIFGSSSSEGDDTRQFARLQKVKLKYTIDSLLIE